MTTRMLLDTSSLTYRAFFALPRSLVDPDGRPVNAVRGVLDMHARLLADHGPDEVVHVFDDEEKPAERVAAWPAYKAQRDPMPDELAWQFELLAETLTAMGLPWVTAPGWEADDAIGTICARAGDGTSIDVVTGDRDLIQLVRDGEDGAPTVRVLYTVKGVRELALLDVAEVEARYGVRPHRYVDFATLRGDPSDGLPGIRGVGEKKARELIARYEDLDALLADASAQTPALAGHLSAAAGYVAAMREVVPVRADVELDWHTGDLNPEAVETIAEDHDLAGPITRLLEVMNG